MSDEIKFFVLNIFLSIKKSKAPCGRPPINKIVANMNTLISRSLEKTALIISSQKKARDRFYI